jgi:glycosyltransferase involved in cell wall biosynthesis
MTIKFTVIIPTRERGITLRHAIETCVAQPYDNLQIIVSDNASQDDTRDIVHSFSDSRIRYVNPGRRVSMVENFEFAFSHVQSGYVVSIGDDDGLAIDAVNKAQALILETKARALVSDFAQYMWPNVESSAANQLMFSSRQGFEMRSAQTYLNKVLYRRHPFNHLPCIYYGFIDTTLINQLKNQQSGRLFMTSVVDVYTAIALSAHLDQYCFSFEPLTINGTSGRSNGASFMQISKDESEKKRWFEENTQTRQPPFYASGGIKMLIAEACHALEQTDTSSVKNLGLNYNEILQQSIEDLLLYPKFGFVEKDILKLARDFGAEVDSPNFLRRLRAKVHLYADRGPKFLRGVIVDASTHGATNVNTAAQLMARLRRRSTLGLSLSKFPMLARRFMAVR